MRVRCTACERAGLVIGQIKGHNPFDMGTLVRMNRHLALAALLILLALVACARTAAGPGQDPFAPYSRNDSGSSHGGGGKGGGGIM